MSRAIWEECRVTSQRHFQHQQYDERTTSNQRHRQLAILLTPLGLVLDVDDDNTLYIPVADTRQRLIDEGLENDDNSHK